MRVQDLQLFLSNFTKGSDAVKNAVIYVEIKAEALGPRTVKLFRGSRILELDACGFKLDACCLGLDACRLMLEQVGSKA
jgi:hypothetical protein